MQENSLLSRWLSQLDQVRVVALQNPDLQISCILKYKFIENLSSDIHIAFPGTTGYSVRNLKYMSKFASEYPNEEFVQTVVA